MQDNIKVTIEKLNERELQQVASALTARLRSRVRAQYKESPATLKELEDKNSAAGIVAAAGAPEVAALQEVPVQALRRMLILMAQDPELRDEVRLALEHRLTASVAGLDVLLVSALVVFVLSVKFDVDVKKTKKGWDVRFKAGKQATPVPLLKSLLSPFLRSGGKGDKA